MNRNFNADFERAVLAALVQDAKFFKEALPVLRTEYFVDQLHAAAAATIQNIYIRTSNPPSKIGLLSGLVEEYKRLLKTKKNQEQELVLDPCQRLVEKLFEPIGEIADVKLTFLDFCRQREMEQALLDQYQKLERGEVQPQQVTNQIQKAHQRIITNEQGGIDFFPDIEGLPDDLVRQSKRRFNTGFSKLDYYMAGGPGAGTLTTFIAPSKFGKSMVLVNVGHANCLRSRVIVHFTLEIHASKLRQRYVARVTGIPMTELGTRTKEAMDKVVQFWALYKPRLFIKEYPTGGASVESFRSYLYWLQSNYDVKPDVVIVDYGDLVKCGGKYEAERFSQGQAYLEMRALAQEFDVAVITASQCNREAMTKQVIKMNDISEAIKKAEISDHIISICRTDEEDAQGKARLYFAGSREAETGKEIPIRFNWSVAMMTESTDKPKEDF